MVLRCLQRTLRACYRSVLDVCRKRPHRQLWPPSLYLTLLHRTPQLLHDFLRFPSLPTQSRVVSRSDSLFKVYQKMPSLLGNLPFALFSTVERVAGRETYGTGQATQPGTARELRGKAGVSSGCFPAPDLTEIPPKGTELTPGLSCRPRFRRLSFGTEGEPTTVEFGLISIPRFVVF